MQKFPRFLHGKFLVIDSLLFVSVIIWIIFAPTQPHLYAEAHRPEALGSISGTARDEAGTPLAGLQVTLYQPFYYDNSWYATRQVTTDSTGRYGFFALTAGAYRIGATDPEARYGATFYTQQPMVEDAIDVVANGTARTGIDLTLVAGAEITGVVQTFDGSKLSNLFVMLYRKVGPLYQIGEQWNEWLQFDTQSLTLEQTKFHFRGLAAGNYRICAVAYDANNWQECYDNVYQVINAHTLTVTAGTVISNVVLTLGDGADLGVIQGRVTSAQAEPLANIGVYVVPAEAFLIDPLRATRLRPAATGASPRLLPNLPYQYYTTTADDGSYTVKHIFDGKYQLLFHDPTGHYRYEYYQDVTYRRNALAIEIAAQRTITDINAQLALGGWITGTITLLGQPAPLTALTLYKQENHEWPVVATTTSDPMTGSYAIGGLPAGVYRLYAVTNISYTPLSSYSFYTFFGGANWETATDIRLTTASNQRDTNINFDHGPHFNGAISGRVTANGVPQSAIRVSLYAYPYSCCSPLLLRPALTYAFTDQDGRYQIEGLSEGSYYVRYDDQNGLCASLFYPNQPILDFTHSVTTTDTAPTALIDMELPQAGILRGHVRSLVAETLPTITVLAVLTTTEQTSFVYREAPLNADGSFVLQGLYPGTYHICAGVKFSYGNGYGGLTCYGDFTPFPSFTSGKAITVTAGKTVNGIDMLWGPDYQQYLPVVAR